MPQHEGHTGHPGRTGHPGQEGFEEELGAVLRRTGDGFDVHDRQTLVAGGLSRGRRRLFRRRLAVTGGALALAAVAVGGVYGGSLVTPAGQATQTTVAASPEKTAAPSDPGIPASEDGSKFQATIPVKDLAAVLKAHTPAGTWEIENEDGAGQSVLGLYDDGDGKAAVSVGLNRAGTTKESGIGQVLCPSRTVVSFDDCTTENLPDGSRLMIIQGYEYPDRRDGIKNWRAVLLTKDGFLVDASEYNAPAQKGSPLSREDPPFGPAQLKALVTAEGWRPFFSQLPDMTKLKPTPPESPGGAGDRPAEPTAAFMKATLRSLLPKGLTVTEVVGDDGFAHAVVDDGRGGSLVGVNVQPSMGDVVGELFSGPGVTTLPDGRLVKETQRAGEKGGAGVVWWSVDTITPEGFRVVVSGFNAPAQHEAATRAEPALTMAQLKALALDPKWAK
ncbi:hypothetical protein [Streptomyces sp. NPDC003327]